MSDQSRLPKSKAPTGAQDYLDLAKYALSMSVIGTVWIPIACIRLCSLLCGTFNQICESSVLPQLHTVLERAWSTAQGNHSILWSTTPTLATSSKKDTCASYELSKAQRRICQEFTPEPANTSPESLNLQCQIDLQSKQGLQKSFGGGAIGNRGFSFAQE